MDKDYEIEIDLRTLLLYLVKRAKIIAAGVLLCTLAVLGISAFVLPPEYEVSTRIYVLNRASENMVSYADYQISNQIIEDYKVLITGQNVTKEVIERLHLDISMKKLEKMIQVTAPENTRVLQITVMDTDPARAVNIANTVREVACDQLQTIMAVESVNLVYEAELPQEPVGPNIMTATVIAAALSFVAMVAILSIVHVLDDTIRTEEDVEMYLGVSVLGVIPADAEIGNLGNANLVCGKGKRQKQKSTAEKK